MIKLLTELAITIFVLIINFIKELFLKPDKFHTTLRFYNSIGILKIGKDLSTDLRNTILNNRYSRPLSIYLNTPSDLDSKPIWNIDNPSIVDFTVANDGKFAIVRPNGKTGMVKITVLDCTLYIMVLDINRKKMRLRNYY